MITLSVITLSGFHCIFISFCSHRLEGYQNGRRLLLRPIHDRVAEQRRHDEQGRSSSASRRLRRRGRRRRRDGDRPQEAEQGATPP